MHLHPMHAFVGLTRAVPVNPGSPNKIVPVRRLGRWALLPDKWCPDRVLLFEGLVGKYRDIAGHSIIIKSHCEKNRKCDEASRGREATGIGGPGDAPPTGAEPFPKRIPCTTEQ